MRRNHHLDVCDDTPGQQRIVPGRHFSGDGQHLVCVLAGKLVRNGFIPEVTLEELHHGRISLYPIGIQESAFIR